MQFQTPSGATHDGCLELPTPIADYQPSLRFPWLAAEVVINKQSKKELLELLNEAVQYDRKKMPFMVALHLLMADLKRCYINTQRNLLYPSLEMRLPE